MDTLQKGTTVEQLKMAYDEAKAYAVEVTYTELAKKVDKVTGKGLSTNDYTTGEKNKLAGIAAGAEVNVQSDWNATSGDAVILNKPTIPAAVAVKGNAESSYRTGNVNITPANIGLGNVGNFKAVSTAASQGLSDTEKSNARANIGAGTGNGTITGIKMNGASKGSSGVVDLGTVITAHQDISGKVNTSTKVNGHALTGNVTVSKTDVGLGNVTNDAQVKRTEMGVASGVATLDSAGKVPSSQLPSYVDDVLEYDTKSAFPATGEGGKIYVDKSNNTSWRWSGSAYTQIKGDLTIGTTSGTAADGKVVNDHINNTSNPHGVTKAQVGLGSVVNTGDSATPVSGGTTKFTTGGAYTELAKKVDKVSGKGLSTNDYTTGEKNKLAGIAAGAEVNVQSDWNATSGDAAILNKPTIPAAAANGTYTVKTLVGSTTTNVSDFTANQSSADDVTFVQGSNVTITPDAKNRKITIAAKDTTYSEATTSAAGLMSSSDKGKLNGIESGAQTHKAPTAAEVKSALGTGSGTSKYLREDGTWRTPPDHTYTVNNGTFAVKGAGTQVASTSANASGNSSVDIVAGSNVTITPDATNNKITISSTDTNTWRPISDSVSSTDSSTSASSKAVKTAYDLAASKTSNTGTVTSVVVKMNGSTKGTVTTSGTIDLGTVITSHQNISGKVDKTTTVNGHALSGNVTVTKSDVGLGNVGNFKAVSTAASQGLTATEQTNARTNIAAVGQTVNKTWAELKALRDNSQLVPGQWYRITDYVTTTTQENTQSAGHAFDIIVHADSANVLNEDAYAALHEGDTYFAGCNLAAWKLRYTIDNIYWSAKPYTTYKIGSDTWSTAPSKRSDGYYRWERSSAEPYYTESLENGATAYFNHGRMVSAGNTLSIIISDTEGFGTIIWMKDENGNECPYDFKNIQFKWTSNISKVGIVANVFYYTFSVATGTNDATITDHSLNGMYCRENKMGKYVPNNYHQLNANVFRNASSTISCGYNTFGNDCYANTFGNGCCHNTFGNKCYDNTFGNECRYNSFGNECKRNSFGNGCYDNTFGNYCYANTFGNGCYVNTFGNYCYANTFGNGCCSNTFGHYFQYNSFGDSDNFITFGNYCSRNTFGYGCCYNTFGNKCQYINFQKNFMDNNIVENGNEHINITSTQTTSYSNPLRNIKIAQGCNNSDTFKTISHDTVGDTFQTVYQPANSQVISV